MKKKIILIIIPILLLILISISIILWTNSNQKDENTLYSKQFGSTVMRFQRYDYALGQNMIIGVEKRTNKEKTYNKVTKEPITVSNEAKFLFLDESIGFVISTGSVTRTNNFIGFKVTQDGGKTFKDATFHYENERVDLITIEDFPYYDGNVLKMECSIYDINSNGDGYEDIKLEFISFDHGLTWSLEE